MKKRFLNIGLVVAPAIFFLALYYGLLIFFSNATERHNLNIRKKIDRSIEKVKQDIAKMEFSIFKTRKNDAVQEHMDIDENIITPTCSNKDAQKLWGVNDLAEDEDVFTEPMDINEVSTL